MVLIFHYVQLALLPVASPSSSALLWFGVGMLPLLLPATFSAGLALPASLPVARPVPFLLLHEYALSRFSGKAVPGRHQHGPVLQ